MSCLGFAAPAVGLKKQHDRKLAVLLGPKTEDVVTGNYFGRDYRMDNLRGMQEAVLGGTLSADFAAVSVLVDAPKAGFDFVLVPTLSVRIWGSMNLHCSAKTEIVVKSSTGEIVARGVDERDGWYIAPEGLVTYCPTVARVSLLTATAAALTELDRRAS
jgi:hypothetical protein